MMKLSNIESRKLLPRFASKIAWLMDALDSIIKPISERVKSIDAPLTLEAIAALTDEELEALYNQYGVAQYYPELSRSTRDLMLYEMCKIYRYLGTPHAIELLCNYIFDNVPLNVHVIDNLAFDEHGTLTDATLLDVFDIEVNPDLPVLSVDATARLLANIIRFSRNSQALRDVIYTFSEDFELYIYPLNAGIPAQNWDNDALCEPVTPPTPEYTEITLYLPSGTKQAQKQVTSGFTGNVSATYCYQLYTDEQLTTPWTGYDYSNIYEFGAWINGVWVPTAIQKVSDLPDTYTSDSTQWKMACILMDNGFLWLASNVSGSGYMAYPSGFIRVHIYPKGETVFAMYPVKTSSMGIYDNKSISTGGQNMQWVRGTSGSTSGGVNFPIMLVNGVYKSGAIFDQSFVSRATVWSSGGNSSTIRASSTSSFSCNAITFTFEQPIYKAWFKSDHTNLAHISAGTNRNLFDENGNNLMFEDDCTYTPCLVFNANGEGNGNQYVNAFQSIVNNSSYLAYKFTNGVLQNVAYVLYTKKYGIDIDVNFGDPVTIPEGYRVESVKCSKLFVKASNVTGNDVTREINFEYLGENLFCTDKNKTWFGAKVSPVIEMFGFSNPSTFGGFRLSCYTTYNTGYAASVSASEFNSGGYFVKGSAVLSSSYTASTYAGYMQTNPMMFRLYSGGNVLAEYHFTIQNSVWSFQNGVFSWVGDDTDYSDLAYWYKSAPGVRIHLRKI